LYLRVLQIPCRRPALASRYRNLKVLLTRFRSSQILDHLVLSVALPFGVYSLCLRVHCNVIIVAEDPIFPLWKKHTLSVNSPSAPCPFSVNSQLCVNKVPAEISATILNPSIHHI